MDIEGKVAVVTGAGSGIGRATALALAKAGADVVVAARTKAQIEAVQREITDLGHRALAVPTDVTKIEDMRLLFDRTIAEMGRADILMNNAGVHMMGRAEQVSLDDWRWIIDVNLWGVIHGVNVFLPHMIERGSGHIVNTGSLAGLAGGLDDSVPYTTTKFAVVGLSEGLAVSLRSKGIGVSVLCPGYVTTNLMDTQRLAKSGDPALDQAWEKVTEILQQGDWSVLGGQVLETDDVAKQVVEAIKENRFLIITHDFTKEIMQLRAQDPEQMIAQLAVRMEQREQGFKGLAGAAQPSP